VVPILVDEARTFGMEGLFRQIGIYNPAGQQYTPVDKDQVMYYKEDKARARSCRKASTKPVA
jgi:pyruvate dehydrogenase E1 component